MRVYIVGKQLRTSDHLMWEMEQNQQHHTMVAANNQEQVKTETFPQYSYGWQGWNDGSLVEEHPEEESPEPRLICLKCDWGCNKEGVCVTCGSTGRAWDDEEEEEVSSGDNSMESQVPSEETAEETAYQKLMAAMEEEQLNKVARELLEHNSIMEEEEDTEKEEEKKEQA